MTYIKSLFVLNYNNIIFINHEFSKKNINIAKKRKSIFMRIASYNPQEKNILLYQETYTHTNATRTYYYII